MEKSATEPRPVALREIYPRAEQSTALKCWFARAKRRWWRHACRVVLRRPRDAIARLFREYSEAHGSNRLSPTHLVGDEILCPFRASRFRPLPRLQGRRYQRLLPQL